MLSRIVPAENVDEHRLLQLVGSAEQYSRHPLAVAIHDATQSIPLLTVARVSETPGAGLVADVDGSTVQITGRAAIARNRPEDLGRLPAEEAGLECVVLVDDRYAGTMQFRDEPREGAREFIAHLGHRHRVRRTLLLSGDRQSEVDYLAARVGLTEAQAQVSPEEKLAIVQIGRAHV